MPTNATNATFPTNPTMLRRKRKNLMTALHGIPLSRDEGRGHRTNAAFTSFRRKFDIPYARPPTKGMEIEEI
jgi:hypothetical protein